MTDSLGERLRIARSGRGLTQDEVFQACNVQPAQISRYETGEAMPNLQTFMRLCDLYEVSADWLLGHEEVSSHDPLYARARHLAPQEAKVARRFIESLLQI